MSNPAVITLAEVNTSLGNFRVEDNLGESIHLHIGEIRCDITIDELQKMADDVRLALDRFIKADGFSVDKFSTEFLLQKASWLPDLVKVEESNIKLNDIQVDVLNAFGIPHLRPLSQSRVLRAINGDSTENNKKQERNYYGQSNQQRVEAMLDSIRRNGYPANGQKIVLLNDKNQIFDGQHRAACLYHLYGNIEVEIIRLYFSNKDYGKFHPLKTRLFEWDKYRIAHNILKILNLLRRIRNKIKFIINSVNYKFDKNKYRNIK